MRMNSREGLLLCFVGPAGAGKTTFCTKLNQTYPDSTKISVSVTSRQKRPGEVEGQSYYFVSRDEFEKRVAEGLFFEWEEVHTNLYGTLLETVETSILTARDLLLDIDIRGALNFKTKYPHNAVIVFLMPPNPDVLKKRLRGRGAIKEDELQLRLQTALQEYELLKASIRGESQVDYLLINEEQEATFSMIRNILEVERLRFKRMNEKYIEGLCIINS